MKYIGKSEKKLVKKAKSGIKIKPENKGKFTATKKETGKTTEELTHSKNPVTKKRAVFAQNAAKWKKGTDKKEQGGSINFLQPLIDAFKCGGKMKPKKKEEGGKLKDTTKTGAPTSTSTKKVAPKTNLLPEVKVVAKDPWAGHLPSGNKYDEFIKKSQIAQRKQGNISTLGK